jgi:hypothetical protein
MSDTKSDTMRCISPRQTRQISRTPESNSAPVETTQVEWSISGTNTSAALASTWTSTTLILPFDSDLGDATQTGWTYRCCVAVSGKLKRKN